ncbi:MAG: beta-Ala-His dipeptidase [Phycisphaerae bacterium]
MSERIGTGGIETLEPGVVWRFFGGLAAVPRPSKREGQARCHLGEVARREGLAFREDDVGNIVMDVPATAGREAAPITVLQAHMDMVCEKNSGVAHDFDLDPIRLIVDTDESGGARIVRADQTTLGADNGLGVAMALAAATSPEVEHGPLELLFTVDEEAGMTGAKALTPDSFRGRRLLNLDSEEDDILYIGCAGGCDTTLTWDLAATPVGSKSESVGITVSGLRGGHSGCDIHENRGNAIKVLAGILARADGELRLAELTGGSKRNAIAREASATVIGPAGLASSLRKTAESMRAEVQAASAELDLKIEVHGPGSKAPATTLSVDDTQRLLACLAALPHGVLGMSRSVPGLVQTSNNVATVAVEPSPDGRGLRATVGTLSRSSSEAWMSATLEQIAGVGRLVGADVARGNAYPGWEPDVDSGLLALCRRVHESLFGAAPEVAAIHAGLECGIIQQRVGRMEMISFGPRIEGAHSPDERVYVASVEKSWRYLVAVLDELSRPAAGTK